MQNWMRRIRGAVGIGLTWGLAWFGAGMILLLIVGLDAADVPFPLFFGFLGFLAGVIFSGILGIAERRRRFDQMSIPRFAGWGAVGGAVLALVMTLILGAGAFPLLGSIFALAGGACAAGSLALARAAEEGGRLDAGSNRNTRRIAGDGGA